MGPGYERPTVKAFVLHSNWQGCGGKSQVCRPEAPPSAGCEERGVGVLGWRQRQFWKGHGPQGSQVEAIGGKAHQKPQVRNDVMLPAWGPSEWRKVELVRVCRDTGVPQDAGPKGLELEEGCKFSLGEHRGREGPRWTQENSSRAEAFKGGMKASASYLQDGEGQIARAI